VKIGVSTACLYPKLLEDALYDLAIHGISNVEIFINSESELRKFFLAGLADTMKRFDMNCVSMHPYTCEMEPMMLFSNYKRRADDMLEYYKKYFEAMNYLGAKIFVFHGNKLHSSPDAEFYCERYSRLVNLGKNFGITVAQENVSRCDSASLGFLKRVKNLMGSDFKLLLDIKQAVRSRENPFDYLQSMGEDIVLVHMSDNGPLGDCLRIGQGTFQVNRFLKILESKSPDSAVILELYRSNFKSTSDLATSCSMLEGMAKNMQKSIL
jgi:sugar phosphate isomerase/epimerase